MSNQPLNPNNSNSEPTIPSEPTPYAERTDRSANYGQQNPFEAQQQPSPNYASSPPPQTSSPYGYGENEANNPYIATSASAQSPSQDPYAQDAYATAQDTYSAHSSTSANDYSQPSANTGTNENTQWNNGTAQNQYQQSYAQSAPQQDLNIKALLGLIFSFFFFPAGLVLSWLGYRETKNSPDNTGRVMSIIGLVVSGIQTVLVILWILLFVFLMILGMAGSGM